MFLKAFLPHWCKTLETYFSWIIFHGGGGVGASGGGCIGETARLHHQRFVVVVTYTPAPCLVSLQDFGPFLVNNNYMQAYTRLSEACFLMDCTKM